MTQDEAIAAGHLTYNTGRPCRRGHNSDRYTSNGMCVACVKMKDDARRTARNLNRRKFINAKVNNFHERTYLVHEDHRAIVEKFCEVLQYGDGFEITHLIDIVEKAHERAPTPRALTFDDLVKVFAWDGKQVTNLPDLELTGIMQYIPDEDCYYFMHNGNRYQGMEVAEVLRGTRLNIKPI